MITGADAIKIGTAICAAVKRESENISKDASRYSARGTGLYAMDNLWYDVLPVQVRHAFDYDKATFYKACGWPE